MSEDTDEVSSKYLGKYLAKHLGNGIDTSTWKDLLEALPDPTILLEENGAIDRANKAWAELLRFAGQEPPAGFQSGDMFLPNFSAWFGIAESDCIALTAALDGILRRQEQRWDLSCSYKGIDKSHELSLTLSLLVLDGQNRVLLQARDTTANMQLAEALRESETRYRLLAELSSEALVLNKDGIAVEANRAACQIFGYSPEELIGMPILHFIDPAYRQRTIASMAEGTNESYPSQGLRKDGSTFPIVAKIRMLPYKGRLIRGICIHDVTMERAAEAALRNSIAQEEKLHAQAQMLAELSTPLIPLNARVMVMPLIGAIDAQRARQVVDTLLEGIARHRTAIAILDITGVAVVDTLTASMMVQAAQAVRLLGAQVVLTGIRSEVAQTLVQLGTELSGVITRSTLESGIAYAMSEHTQHEADSSFRRKIR